jgi:hypothetical protein
MLSNKKIIELFNRLKSEKNVWLGWRDSNPRMHGPKPCALPLGHTPLFGLEQGYCNVNYLKKQRLWGILKAYANY